MRGRWGTPWPLLRAVEKLLGIRFVFDVATDPPMAKAFRFFTLACGTLHKEKPRPNALTIGWARQAKRYPFQYGITALAILDRAIAAIAFWCNPPYDDPGPWLEKCALEASKGLVVAALVPDDRGTIWWQEHVEGKAALLILPTRRVSFIHRFLKRPMKGNGKASAIVVYYPWRPAHPLTLRLEWKD